MRIYTNKDVLTAARERIRYLFSEFENIVVSISGGKDSTVVFYLCLEAAKELNRLPLSVFWLDQEAEWQATADYVESIMTMPEVKPYWYQIPMVITNNASTLERYNYCWREGDEWIRDKHLISIKENNYGTDRFHELLVKIETKDFPKNTAIIGGMRAQESPTRMMTLGGAKTYKHITFGKKITKDKFVFHPIYDWEISDVWTYIHRYSIPYNKIYDLMYNYGVSYKDMRVSNLHHETSVQNLLLIQELEPETWVRIAKKIHGANAVSQLKMQAISCPDDLPYMFKDWQEYAFYLADKLIVEEQYKKMLFEKINSKKKLGFDYYSNASDYAKERYWKIIINTILVADYDFTKLGNQVRKQDYAFLNWLKSNKTEKFKSVPWSEITNDKYLSEPQKQQIWNILNSQ